ncbi:MAG TPA: AAA family ATPase [Geminicoccus sp.]|jgi:uncharacterized protein involved in exopolysaccharide biosynthesis|uniref:GumC family protein n=1 Tax=Geminicoccus sp. TaxID=2024832 RepID=UPI002E352184|nr:AAA family ATPase [Geminicoccus sp.]HEX2526774.1 AAA family ATPase [Geminicoccus sp.]
MNQVQAQRSPAGMAGTEPAGIIDQLRILRRRWPVILGMTAIGLGASLGTARLITPVFVARTEVIYEPVSNGGLDGLEQVVAAPEGGTLDSQVQQIASHALAREVVQRLGLDQDPELSVGSLAPAWASGAPVELEALDATVPVEPLEPSARLLDAFLARLQVAREGKSHVIAITWRSTDPAKAAAVANEVALGFVTSRIAEKHAAAERATQRLQQRRDGLRAAMFEAEARLNLARTTSQPILTAALGAGEDQIGTLSRQLVDAKMDAGTRSVRVRRLKEAVSRGETIMVGVDQGRSVVFQNLMARETDSAREEGELLAQYGDRHPLVVDLRSRRGELARKIRAEQRRMLDEMELEAQVAQSRADDLASQIEAIKGSTAGLVRSRQEIAGLEDDLRARRVAFESFDMRFLEITQRLADQAPDARIVSEATPPSAPVFPRQGAFMAVGGSVSFLLAGLFVWLTEARDRSVRTARDLERITSLATIAMVPRLVRKNERLRPHDVPLDQPLGRYGEALRDMLATLTQRFDRPQGRGCSVLITSAVPDEGKTTTAISLARMAAAEGLKVVLIDGDLRHPSVLGRLGLDKGPGLQEILQGKATLEQALRTDPRSGLQILPGSSAGRTALASQSGERLRQVVHSLTRDVDMVVVDAAPALAVAELRDVRAPLAGCVLTAVDLKKQPLYGLDDRSFAYVRHARYYAS